MNHRLRAYRHVPNRYVVVFDKTNESMVLFLPPRSTGLEHLRDAPLVPSENLALDLCVSDADCNVTSDGTMEYEHIALLPSNRLETILTELASGGGGSGAAQNGPPVRPQTASFSGAVGATFSPQTLLAKILGCMGRSHKSCSWRHCQTCFKRTPELIPLKLGT